MSSKLKHKICILIFSGTLWLSPCVAQSALKTSLGLGYNVLGYDVSLDGLKGIEVLQGPQVNMDISLGLGPIFSIGADADLTIANNGAQLADVETFDLLATTSYIESSNRKVLTGSYFSVGINSGVYFKDYKPKLGIGYTQIETNDQNGQIIRQVRCFDWKVKPLDFDFATTFNIVAEYKQSLPNCEINYKSASFAARITF